MAGECPTLSVSEAATTVIAGRQEGAEPEDERDPRGYGILSFKAWFVDFEPVHANLEGRWHSGQSLRAPARISTTSSPIAWWTRSRGRFRRCGVSRLNEILAELVSGARPKGGAIDQGVPSIGAENVIGLGKYDFSKEKYVPRELFEYLMRKGAAQATRGKSRETPDPTWRLFFELPFLSTSRLARHWAASLVFALSEGEAGSDSGRSGSSGTRTNTGVRKALRLCAELLPNPPLNPPPLPGSNLSAGRPGAAPRLPPANSSPSGRITDRWFWSSGCGMP